MFVDVHTHMVPSGDDGVFSIEEGLELCREAAERGTSVLYATPHVWPREGLSAERERAVRAAHAEMAPAAEHFGLDLRLGFELTPAAGLLDQDLRRYRLGDLSAVLMELPFHGSLDLALAVGEAIETAALVPVIAHPERSEQIVEQPGLAEGLKERDWLLQLNASSLLGRHGPDVEAAAWRLVDTGLADLVGSDGHRRARPPFLDEAYRAVRARRGEAAESLFDGRRLLAVADRVDLAQGR